MTKNMIKDIRYRTTVEGGGRGCYTSISKFPYSDVARRTGSVRFVGHGSGGVNRCRRYSVGSVLVTPEHAGGVPTTADGAGGGGGGGEGGGPERAGPTNPDYNGDLRRDQ